MLSSGGEFNASKCSSDFVESICISYQVKSQFIMYVCVVCYHECIRIHVFAFLSKVRRLQMHQGIKFKAPVLSPSPILPPQHALGVI